MSSVDTAVATFERNIETKTGRSVSDWVEAVRQSGLTKHGAMVAWLKAEFELSHAHANHVAKRALAAASPLSAEGPVAHLFEGGKDGLRPVYDQLARAATGGQTGAVRQFQRHVHAQGEAVLRRRHRRRGHRLAGGSL